VHPSNPARTFQDFVRDHRTANFTFGTAGVGSGAHITAEYVFRVLAKIEAIHTPYQGSPQAVSALLGNLPGCRQARTAREPACARDQRRDPRRGAAGGADLPAGRHPGLLVLWLDRDVRAGACRSRDRL
jgi:hypothetical protein